MPEQMKELFLKYLARRRALRALSVSKRPNSLFQLSDENAGQPSKNLSSYPKDSHHNLSLLLSGKPFNGTIG
jgi:hypothetical protein